MLGLVSPRRRRPRETTGPRPRPLSWRRIVGVAWLALVWPHGLALADEAAGDAEPGQQPTRLRGPHELAKALTSPGASPTDANRPAPGAEAKLRYNVEGIELRGNLRTADRVVLRYVPFSEGDLLDPADPEVELMRFRLLGTGFFSDVRVSLRRGSKRGWVVLVLDVVERNTLILENLAMGIAADEDADGNSEPIAPYLGVEAAETNLAGLGVTLGAGFGVADEQFSLRTRFAYPHIDDTSWMLTGDLHYIDARDFFGNKQVSFESPLLIQRHVTDYAVVSYTRFGGSVGGGVELSLPLRVMFDYQLERVVAIVPMVASHVRGRTREPIDFDILPDESVLSMVHTSMVYDSRDTPFLPKKGDLAIVRGSLGLEALGSSYGFGKLEASYAHWWKLPWRHVVSVRGELGAITGDAPFFEKFYVGDFTDLLPDRVLGLNPDRRQPPNYLGTDIVEIRYGDYAARLEGEYRIPLYSGQGSIYGIDFVSAFGLYGVAARRDFTDPPSGYEGFERVPIDLTFNLGLRIETYVGGFSFAFSNLIGLLPARGGDRK